MAKANTEAVIEIGRRMTAVREALDHGEFLAWVREAIPFEPRTVQRYQALAAWADAEPVQARRLARLGPSKLYRVAALPRSRVVRLKLAMPVSIPGGDGPKPLDTMTVA
ncbi:MAG: DUF3102 domain-containing protein [Nannocystaceae bacterium]|nr:DUF3102 domain-containing protein [Nannocystaceae bacterium]